MSPRARNQCNVDQVWRPWSSPPRQPVKARLPEEPMTSSPTAPGRHNDLKKLPSCNEKSQDAPMPLLEVLLGRHNDLKKLPSCNEKSQDAPMPLLEVLLGRHNDLKKLPSCNEKSQDAPMPLLEVLLGRPQCPRKPSDAVKSQNASHPAFGSLLENTNEAPIPVSDMLLGNQNCPGKSDLSQPSDLPSGGQECYRDLTPHGLPQDAPLTISELLSANQRYVDDMTSRRIETAPVSNPSLPEQKKSQPLPRVSRTGGVIKVKCMSKLLEPRVWKAMCLLKNLPARKNIDISPSFHAQEPDFPSFPEPFDSLKRMANFCSQSLNQTPEDLLKSFRNAVIHQRRYIPVEHAFHHVYTYNTFYY